MKKSLKFTLIILGILVIGLTGCSKKQNDFIGEESTAEITTNSDVTLSIKEGTLTNTGATILLKNNSDKSYSYGNPYELEIKKDGQWHHINVVLYFTLPAYGIKPGETKEIELNWKGSYGKLSKGTYRIIKGISYEYEKNKYETFSLAVEFNIDN